MGKFERLWSPVAITNAEESPKDLTPAQLARRRQMAATLCASALNRTSALMAKRLCLAWFGKCEQCPYEQEANAN